MSSGIFTNADSVIARVNRRNEVSGIELSYGAGTSWSSLMQRIEDMATGVRVMDRCCPGMIRPFGARESARVSAILLSSGRIRIRLTDREVRLLIVRLANTPLLQAALSCRFVTQTHWA